MTLRDGLPYAKVKQIGRWTYRVTVHHGLMQWGPDGGGWYVSGWRARERAERKASKVLLAYWRTQEMLGQPTITIGG